MRFVVGRGTSRARVLAVWLSETVTPRKSVGSRRSSLSLASYEEVISNLVKGSRRSAPGSW
jgi:hypothetical protein